MAITRNKINADQLIKIIAAVETAQAAGDDQSAREARRGLSEAIKPVGATDELSLVLALARELLRERMGLSDQ